MRDVPSERPSRGSRSPSSSPGGELADHVEDLGDQLGVERARDLIQQQDSGSIANARTIATRCCWPPESRSGYSSALSASPNRSSSSRALRGLRRGDGFSTLTGASVTFCEHRHVREEVERLEHDADPPAHGVQVDPGRGDVLPSIRSPGVDRLEQVDAAQAGWTSPTPMRRSGRPPRASERRDRSLQYLEIVEGLVERPRCGPIPSQRRPCLTATLVAGDHPIDEARLRDRDRRCRRGRARRSGVKLKFARLWMICACGSLR